MTDPAVEAAQRARAASGGFVSTHDIASAREALAPIQAVAEAIREERSRWKESADFRAGVDLVLGELDPLIYTSEELK